MSTPSKSVVAFVCGVSLVALTSCGSTTPSAGTAPGAGSGTPTSTAGAIMIHGFAFTTPPSVHPGAQVSVDNMDGVAHTVTDDKGSAFNSPAPPGNSSFMAPSTAGSYPFHCNIHPEMHGTLVVR